MPTKELRRILAVWLEEGMDKAGLNQSSLAKKSHVSRDTIWRIVHEKTDAGEEKLKLLSDAIGRPLPVLSDVSRQMPATQPQRPAGPQTHAEAVSGAIGRDSATASLVREKPVGASQGLYTDVRPPMGEEARLILERRIEAVTQGAPLTSAEVDYWLKLVRWAATAAEGSAGATVPDLAAAGDAAFPADTPSDRSRKQGGA